MQTNRIELLCRDLHKPKMKRLIPKHKPKSYSLTLTTTEYLRLNNNTEYQYFSRGIINANMV